MAGDKKTSDAGGLRCTWGIILLPICLFLGLSLFSYEWQDISLLRVPPKDPPMNLFGPVGAWCSFVLFMAMGVGAYLVPVLCLAVGLLLILNSEEKIWPRLLWGIGMLVAAVNLLELHSGWWTSLCKSLNIQDPGGVLSHAVTHGVLVELLSPVGTGILLWSLFLTTGIMFAGWPNVVRAWKYSMSGSQLLAEKVSETRGKIEEQLELGRDRNDAKPREKNREKERDRDTGKDAKGEPGEERRRRQVEIDREQQEIEERKKQLDKALERHGRIPEAPEAPAPDAKAPTKAEAKPELKPEKKSEPKAEKKPEPVVTPSAPEPLPGVVQVTPAEKPVEKPAPARKAAAKPSEPAVLPLAGSTPGTYQLPPLDTMDPVPSMESRMMKTDTTTASKILVETLQEFGIDVTVQHCEEGPTVARYELLPAPGVKIERIGGLSNNLAMALKAHSVRVQAPIPGKGLVGVEVPNATAAKIYLRDVLEGEVWKAGRARLPLALGKDVGGNDLVADLAAMPHLLVAGATGSGKTVCINSILVGLLMTRSPADLRLMLVDPKIVEFSGYNDLPHLVVPVVTNPKKVAIALRWAINEMEKRYKMFAKVGVRNIDGFNSREIRKQQSLFGDLAPADRKDHEVPDRIPYIVIVVDELADLMLVDQAEIEHCIARLAQLSRAVGIHMILATQRPSVKVITGTIKANFPARIAFQLPQQVDSRTILDSPGAEKLLGKGDMLFLPPGSSKLVRAQGAILKDEEIKRVVEFIKKQAQPQYEIEVQQKMEKPAPRGDEPGEEDDELINEAIAIVRETHRASTSSLQRRLRIGYTRAARVMDILEERGIVGPPRGSDAREILIDLDAGSGDSDGQIPVDEDGGEEGSGSSVGP